MSKSSSSTYFVGRPSRRAVSSPRLFRDYSAVPLMGSWCPPYYHWSWWTTCPSWSPMTPCASAIADPYSVLVERGGTSLVASWHRTVWSRPTFSAHSAWLSVRVVGLLARPWLSSDPWALFPSPSLPSYSFSGSRGCLFGPWLSSSPAPTFLGPLWASAPRPAYLEVITNHFPCRPAYSAPVRTKL